MKLVAVSEAKARLTGLVKDAKNEDVALLRYGHPEAFLLSADRYEELIERLDDVEDSLAVAEFRANPEPTIEIGELRRRIEAGEDIEAS